jgi:hypothetical protein
MDHSLHDDDKQARLRCNLIAIVSASSWNGPTVIDYCRRCRLSKLETFIAALKSSKGSIPLGFRWASVDDMGWLKPADDVD